MTAKDTLEIAGVVLAGIQALKQVVEVIKDIYKIKYAKHQPDNKDTANAG